MPINLLVMPALVAGIYIFFPDI